MSYSTTPERVTEVFAVLGAPARALGRVLLITRYIWNGFTAPWLNNEYAVARFGERYQWKPWLLFDIAQLEKLEYLINEGSDEEVWAYRVTQITTFQISAVIGALVVQAALTALQMPGLEDVDWKARACLSISIIISLMATFFTWLQQRAYSFIADAKSMRLWLSNGIEYHPDQKSVRQSSILAYQTMQVPFELISIAITLFLAGLGAYFGSTMTRGTQLEDGTAREDNRTILVSFIIVTVFILGLLGQLLGGKDVEVARCKALEKVQGMDESAPYPLYRQTSPGEDLGPNPPATHTIHKAIPAFDLPERLNNTLQKVVGAHRACAAANEELASLYEEYYRPPDDNKLVREEEQVQNPTQ